MKPGETFSISMGLIKRTEQWEWTKSYFWNFVENLKN